MRCSLAAANLAQGAGEREGGLLLSCRLAEVRCLLVVALLRPCIRYPRGHQEEFVVSCLLLSLLPDICAQ